MGMRHGKVAFLQCLIFLLASPVWCQETLTAQITAERRDPLLLFANWAGSPSRVRADFTEQGVEWDEDLANWVVEHLSRLTLRGDRIPIAIETESPAEDWAYLDLVFTVFVHGPYVDLVRNQFESDVDETQDALDRQVADVENRSAGGRDLEALGGRLVDTRTALTDLTLKQADAEARLQTAQDGLATEERVTQEKIQELRQPVRELDQAWVTLNAEIKEARRQRAKLGLQSDPELVDLEERLLEIERLRARRLANIEELAQKGWSGTLPELSRMEIEAQAELAGLTDQQRILEQRIQSLQQQIDELQAAHAQTVVVEQRLRERKEKLARLDSEDIYRLMAADVVPDFRLKRGN